MQKNNITLVMAYYENGGMLDRHFEEWKTYPKKDFKVILVDDGSQNDPAINHIKKAKFPVELYRIKIDIPWNQNGARNLGMTHANGWCLLTDMDHLLSKDQFETLYKLKLSKDTHYVPGRKKANGEWYKRHPNSYIIHKDTYWKAGGYDEAFCGYYGTDATFRRQLGNTSKRVELEETFYLTLYGREVIADASTRNYGRKGTKYHTSRNPKLRARKRLNTLPIPPLNFPWERLI
jgi:predicted glycosyltransferase involved in capsule biosynthesis